MVTPVEISILALFLGLIFVAIGLCLYIYEKRQKNLKNGLISNLDLPKFIEELGKFIEKIVNNPGGLGVLFIIVGFLLILLSIYWWLYPPNGILPATNRTG